jgi:peptide-methionine (S)-S-oxide reductase
MNSFWERLGGSALTLNRAGNDVGTQYRSGLYYFNDEQREICEASAKRVAASFGKPIVTELLPGDGNPFYLAEPEHQKYLERGGQDASKEASAPIRCYG